MSAFPKFNPWPFVSSSVSPIQALGDLETLEGEDNVIPFRKKLASLTRDERDDFEERAAIMEFDGKIERPKAMIAALADILGRKGNGAE